MSIVTDSIACKNRGWPIMASTHRCPKIHLCRDRGDNQVRDWWDIRGIDAADAARIFAGAIDRTESGGP